MLEASEITALEQAGHSSNRMNFGLVLETPMAYYANGYKYTCMKGQNMEFRIPMLLVKATKTTERGRMLPGEGPPVDGMASEGSEVRINNFFLFLFSPLENFDLKFYESDYISLSFSNRFSWWNRNKFE